MKRRTALLQRSDAGFTLLELLLALSLLALLIGALLGGLTLSRKAFDGGRIHQAAGDLEAAATALSKLLARAYPLVIVDAPDHEAPSFVGRPDGCNFIGLSDGHEQRGGLFAAQIGLAPGLSRHGDDLAVWTRSIRADEALGLTANGMDKTEAARDVAVLSFSYFGQIEDDKPPRWTDAWIGTVQLPQLVAVRLGAIRHGRPIDASFVVALPQQRL
jgi:prepilin-type N-terminal cleavage/methylation domain-containing protein